MKNLIFGMALCLAAVCVCAEEGTTLRLKDRGNTVQRDVYLLMGQSNMAGRGQLTDANRILPKDGIMTFDKNNQWVQAVEPLHWDKPAVVGAGLGASFAVEMQKVSGGREIGLVPCAVGGSYISSWVPGGELYTNAVARCRAALAAGGTLKGILWHQGCADAGSPETATNYAARLTQMVAQLRKDLDAPDVPFVAGELGRYLKEFRGLDPKHPTPELLWQTVNEQIHAAVKAIPNAAVVSSEGLAPNPDILHFNTPSVRKLGARYAEALRGLKTRRGE